MRSSLCSVATDTLDAAMHSSLLSVATDALDAAIRSSFVSDATDALDAPSQAHRSQSHLGMINACRPIPRQSTMAKARMTLG